MANALPIAAAYTCMYYVYVCVYIELCGMTCFPIKRMLKSAAAGAGGRQDEAGGWQQQLQLDLINISPRLKVRVVCKCRNFAASNSA